MAAKDQLDHDVLGGFAGRIGPAGAGRAAENIAYGYDSFPKTLTQWIDSSGHRKNLLLPNASRVGVASARSASTGRTYWAMVIAGDYERRPRKGTEPLIRVATPKLEDKSEKKSVARSGATQACRLKILSLCL
jgi:hypothetical protein